MAQTLDPDAQPEPDLELVAAAPMNDSTVVAAGDSEALTECTVGPLSPPLPAPDRDGEADGGAGTAVTDDAIDRQPEEIVGPLPATLPAPDRDGEANGGAGIAVTGDAVEAQPAPVATGPATVGSRESGRARQRRQRKAEQTDTPLYRLKLEGVHALGLWDKVQSVGWGGLSAAESGRVGGYITRILRAQRQDAAPSVAPQAGGE